MKVEHNTTALIGGRVSKKWGRKTLSDFCPATYYYDFFIGGTNFCLGKKFIKKVLDVVLFNSSTATATNFVCMKLLDPL